MPNEDRAGIKNGELLRHITDAGFEVFSTSKNLRLQQNLSSFNLAVIVLPTNQVPVVQALLPQIDGALRNIRPNDLAEL